MKVTPACSRVIDADYRTHRSAVFRRQNSYASVRQCCDSNACFALATPPLVSDALTLIGSEIAPLLANVMQWLGTRITHIADSQQEFDSGPAAKV